MAPKANSRSNKGIRIKRKSRVNPSSCEPNKIVPSPQHEFFTVSPGQVEAAASNMLNVSQGSSGQPKLDFELTNAVDALDFRLNRMKEGDEVGDCPNDLTEAKLEELVLTDVHIRFERLIQNIVAITSYPEDVVTKAMLRFSNCCGSKDTFSNIVNNTLAFLSNGQEDSPSKEDCFDDLAHIEKYILAELVCMIQEVRPSLTVRDALWRLLVFDLNLLQACANNARPLRYLVHKGTADSSSSVQTESQSIFEANGHELNLPVPSGNPGANELENSQILGGSLSTAATSESHQMVELGGCVSNFHYSFIKKQNAIRQKFFLESKGSSRVEKIKSMKGLIETTTTNLDCASSLNISNATGLDASEGESSTRPIRCNDEEPNSVSVGIPSSKSRTDWIAEESKDEIISKLAPKVQELKDEITKWTEWGHQKIMQATNQLKKEKEEKERLMKERKYLEESSTRRISEMQSALDNARAKVVIADATARKLEAQNSAFRKEMEAAKLRAAKSMKSFQEVLKREKDLQVKIKSQEGEKSLFQEMLLTEKRNFAKLQQELKQAKEKKEQAEVRWQQAKKATEEVLMKAISIREEREKIEESTKYREEQMKLKAEKSLQSYEADIKKYEEEIAEIRWKEDHPKIAALRMGIDDEESWNTFVTELVTDMDDFSVSGSVKRERECAMCLYEEISVVFLPCAHQVVCDECNERLVKQGIQECPSCRTPIQKRISVRHATRGEWYVFG